MRQESNTYFSSRASFYDFWESVDLIFSKSFLKRFIYLINYIFENKIDVNSKFKDIIYIKEDENYIEQYTFIIFYTHIYEYSIKIYIKSENEIIIPKINIQGENKSLIDEKINLFKQLLFNKKIPMHTVKMLDLL